MFNWLHHILNPHCEHCLEERRESKVCDSCEVLKSQIARLENENDKLLNRILEKPEVEKSVDTGTLKPILPANMPWRVRQQALEREDRVKAQLMKRSEDAIKVTSTEDLEKELGVAEQAREAAKG